MECEDAWLSVAFGSARRIWVYGSQDGSEMSLLLDTLLTFAATTPLLTCPSSVPIPTLTPTEKGSSFVAVTVAVVVVAVLSPPFPSCLFASLLL